MMNTVHMVFLESTHECEWTHPVYFIIIHDGIDRFDGLAKHFIHDESMLFWLGVAHHLPNCIQNIGFLQHRSRNPATLNEKHYQPHMEHSETARKTLPYCHDFSTSSAQ